MSFCSIDFAIFLPLVFILYWFIADKNLRVQNFLVVVASYIFYAWWDWRFLSLIFFSTVVDYSVGIGLSKNKDPIERKLLLWTSIAVNIGFLAFFKYFNFFIDNFVEAYSFFFQEISVRSLNIILPIGISFYTFQTLSYTIDVYRERLQPTRDFVSFAAFVSFFPQLVAGPIERATRLLPQFYQKRTFIYEDAVDGLQQILWGFFKKLVVADNCAALANMIFNNSADYSGSTLLLGALFFTFQIYGDFSGYSDIAIGTARLFGFRLSQNFAFPYFSRDMAEFWRRWHISLSTWFRDYVYIPLGGSRTGKWLNIRNVFVIFIVSGFWHGANWTFIVWGALNALYFLPLLLLKRNRKNLDVVAKGRLLPSFRELVSMGTTFGLAVLGWIFFRAENISHALSYLAEICSPSILTFPEIINKQVLMTILMIGFLLAVEWLGRESEYGIEKMRVVKSRTLRWGFYLFILFLIGMFMHSQQTPFIYFQF